MTWIRIRIWIRFRIQIKWIPSTAKKNKKIVILSIHNPSLGSREVPRKIWALFGSAVLTFNG